MRYAPIPERFSAKVRRSGGCWTWTANTSSSGYGRFWNGSTTVQAHRFAWELANGPIPNGMDVLHHCDNPPCVRPSHLFLGTDIENNADMRAKGRATYHNALKTHCKNGHPFDRTIDGVQGRRRQCRQCQRAFSSAHYRRTSKRGPAAATRTQCPRGHPYDATNTYVYRGHRQCVTCRRDRNHARKKKAA